MLFLRAKRIPSIASLLATVNATVFAGRACSHEQTLLHSRSETESRVLMVERTYIERTGTEREMSGESLLSRANRVSFTERDEVSRIDG